MTPGQCQNLLSARSNPVAVSTTVLKEVNRGHTAGPFSSLPFDMLHCSPLGAVPKKDGSHRIILDLSSPRGSSINEGISPELYSVTVSILLLMMLLSYYICWKKLLYGQVRH